MGPGEFRKAPITDEATFHSAARQQHHLGAAEAPQACDPASVGQAVTLIYQHDDARAAAAIAQRCDLLAITQGRGEHRSAASRIRALIAIKGKDMAALQSAGEALVADAHAPEAIADGHMFIAFACTFSGRADCGRAHLESAKALFARHEVAGALEQLMSVEQALLKLEQSPSP